jgi:PAS domain S-box-containing protein
MDDSPRAFEDGLFRLLVQNSSDIITLLGRDGTVLYQSPAIGRVLGYPPEQRIGKNIFHSPLVHPEDADRERDFLEATLHDPGAHVVAEFRLRHADGSFRHIEAVATNLLHEPAVAGIVAIYRDVTARAQADEVIRDSERRLRSLAEALPQLVWTAEPDGRYDYTNRRWTDFTGLTAEGSLGWGWCEAAHPEDRPRCLKRWIRALRAGEPYEFEYRLRKADGSYRWFLRRALPMRDAEGRIIHWFGTCTDIDDRKRAEAESQAALEAAEAANRAKDQFLAMLSHELRNPLNPILLAATAALQDEAAPLDQRPIFEMIRQNVALETRLIDDLLDVTRAARGKMHYEWEVVDAHDLLRRTFELCISDWRGKGLALVADLAARGRYITADPARLQQVIWNLLRNAIKFTPEGGKIDVRTRDEGGRLFIEVADSGIGIEPADVDRIFKAFEQVEDPRYRKLGGLGLGLALSRSITEAHGGTLAASSPGRDQGATFTLVLPLAAPENHSRGDCPPDADRAPGQEACKLLLVEDDPVTLRVMAKLLRGIGHTVTTADTAAGALAVATADFDVVIGDLGMPDGSGIELMRRLREEHGLCGIALTGFGADEDIARGREAGFVAHLTKPVDFPRLVAAIGRAVTSRRQRLVSITYGEEMHPIK